VAGLEQYMPTLDRIIRNETYMHAADAAGHCFRRAGDKIADAT
jgi:hypothetical protein